MNMQEQSSGGVFWKRYSKNILENLQENICAEILFLIKLRASIHSQTLLKKNLKNSFFLNCCKTFNNKLVIEQVQGQLLNVMPL